MQNKWRKNPKFKDDFFLINTSIDEANGAIVNDYAKIVYQEESIIVCGTLVAFKSTPSQKSAYDENGVRHINAPLISSPPPLP